jgi:hypothetical protein
VRRSTIPTNRPPTIRAKPDIAGGAANGNHLGYPGYSHLADNSIELFSPSGDYARKSLNPRNPQTTTIYHYL